MDKVVLFLKLVIRLYFRAILPSSISVKEASAKITVATTRDTSVFSVDPWILVYADEGHGYQPGEYLTVRLTGYR